MAVPGIKYDDGTGGFATNCFPVRGLIQENEEDGSGAWLVAHKAEQRRRFKAVVCAKPRTYSQIREERKRALKDGGKMVPPEPPGTDADDEKVLDGFFLMKHCCVEDPVDLCSVNVSGQDLTDVKAEDFCLFDNVAYVNVSENVLPFETFNNFPIIRELEMSLNCIRNIKLNVGDFPNLETLDLSYNNLAPEDLLPLGLIPNLRVLSLTGNYLKTLPQNLTKPFEIPETMEEVTRFPNLEILMLDNNKFSDVSVFAALAGLRRLRHLNVAKNGLYVVPQLMLIDGRHVTQESDSMKKSIRKLRSGRKSSRSARRQKSSHSSTSNGRKSILKNTPSLEGPTNTPLMKKRTASDSDREGLSMTEASNGEKESVNHSVKFRDNQAEGGTDNLSSTTATGLELASLAALELPGEESALDVEVKPVEDDLDFGELNLEQLDEKIEEETFQEAVAEANAKSLSGTLSTGLTPPPFPELRTLDLSHNQIVDEDSLLAVAAWPLLSEMSIHDNPLTTQNSGDPPLLKRYLTERLGIKIIRKRPEGPAKPRVEVQAKPERKVQTIIPPVPRCNVEELLALEAPKDAPGSGRSSASTIRSSRISRHTPTAPSPASARLDRTTPLPPIPPSPKPENNEDADRREAADPSDGDVFFMTQVEDQKASEQQPMEPGPKMVPQPPKKPKAKSKRRKEPVKPAVPDQYKGYEELLNIPSDEDDGEEVGQDLSSNVKSLQYMLKHPLLFREKNAPLDQPQPPFRPLTKGTTQPPQTAASGRLSHTPMSCPPRKTKEEELSEVLLNMRERSTVIETNLAEVIKEQPSHEHEFKEAPRLLTEMHDSYYYDDRQYYYSEEDEEYYYYTDDSLSKTDTTSSEPPLSGRPATWF